MMNIGEEHSRFRASCVGLEKREFGITRNKEGAGV
jgi:hypothetical protein